MYRNILTLPLIIAVSIVLLPGSATSQQKSLKEQIVGTRRTVTRSFRAPMGRKQDLSAITLQVSRSLPATEISFSSTRGPTFRNLRRRIVSMLSRGRKPGGFPGNLPASSAPTR